ncbi:hypothetical protein Pla22_31600 [Rubripirellula amarantea]|uniref:Mce/MlaD domain-containing protein n=1 Tax=Rubripirellula amarantea TaxID=2527999 RepID=A0A5C5WIL7_9BACT|nr:MlaD family protein [Rubripirellula amarantea]TWT50417.1 hypothetical protein Pla22_31600 [Rubripirellula amarantea]
MNEPYRLRYANQIVGLFLLVLLLFLVLIAGLFLRAGDLFVKQDKYWIEMAQDQVKDLHRGAEVQILGDRAGQVEDISYIDGSNMIRVELAIDPKMSPQISEDSIVTQERKYGLGTPILVIRRGKAAGSLEPLQPGNQLLHVQSDADRIDQMAREVESVADSVRMIQQKLDPTLSGVRDASDRFQSSLDNTVDPAFSQGEATFQELSATNEVLRPEALDTLQTIRSATEDLQNRVATLTDKIQTLVEKDMRETLVQVQESTDDVSAAAKNVDANSDLVASDIGNTLVELRKAADQVQKLAIETREVVRIVRREADELPGTTARVNDTVNETQDLVGEIRSHWLLRRYSKQNTPSDQISPSSVRGGSGF